MRTIFSLILVSIMLWSCSKKNDVTPTPTDTTKTPPVTTIPDTTKKLTRDDSIHMVAFIIYPQKVKTTVSGKVLTLALDENLNLFVLADAYQTTYAVHLTEDFKSTRLGAFDFTTISEDGITAHNYIEGNLNNVKTKTISDTTIKGVKVKKINVRRTVTFSKEYGSNQLATDQQNLILGKTDDILTFSSYIYYQKNYPVTSAVAYLKYVK
ncbi:hypothetical protein KXD93_29970 [Mucilaginibacter sp. BJC16-A38]|uniref:hypothetical protein n=1 Tax=Mucilaginibacter phenanthrenivorans TaxID=1234842 RepID=UPI002157BD04|nr:hypothetical protein [Mucilaginibacter phenanthrenivorans]MCR8561920.1 hypothetical protein [Mucilaginibacter phenanthrenivorans]